MATLTDMFGLTAPLAELLLRGAVGFLALVALVRIVPKRNAGHISPNDMLVLIVVGALGADAISGGDRSTGDLLLMVAVVLLLGYALDLLEYHVPAVRRLMRHRQTRLIRDGRFQRRNMRRELITEEEMRSAMRLAGIESVDQVREAVLEADGEISLMRRK